MQKNLELVNFTVQNDDPQRPSGTCEAGGHPARAELDRSGPRARLTVRFGPDGEQVLPPEALDGVSLLIAGTAVPAAAVNLDGGGEALRARLDPALADALVGGGAAPPADPGAGKASGLVELSRQHDAAKAERAAHSGRAKELEAEAAGLRERLGAVEAELAEAGDRDAAHSSRCADLRQRIRELLDAEEA